MPIVLQRCALVLLFTLAPFRAATACDDPAIFADLVESKERLLGNLFNVKRDLIQYGIDLGSAALKDVNDLKPDQQWVDMGAGEGQAARQYLKLGGKGKMKLVGFKKPPSYELEVFLMSHPERVEYLDKEYVEDIKPERLGKTRVITDLYGPMTYTFRPTEVLAQYGTILEEGGSAHILLANKYMLIRLGKEGPPMTLAVFLRQYCKGFDVINETVKGRGYNGETSAIHLVRNKDPISIPMLKYSSYKNSPSGKGAPKRDFYFDLPN